MSQTYRVESLALHHVGAFSDVRLDFKPIPPLNQDDRKAEIHLFAGPNGCGKSTLLYAIAEIFGAFDNNGLVRRRFWGTNSWVDFAVYGTSGHYGTQQARPNRVPNSDDALGQFSVALHHDKSAGLFFDFDGTGWESELAKYKLQAAEFQPNQPHSLIRFPFAVFAYSGQRSLADLQLGAIQPINESPFENALSFDNAIRSRVLLQWIANNRAQAALARQDGDTAAADGYDFALTRITRLIRDICDIEVEFRLQRAPLTVSISVNGIAIHFDGLPDGLKSIISWVADLSLRLEAIPWVNETSDVFLQPVILLLDEVDIHLHPKWQRRILPAMQNLLPNGQIFVSTHSPFVVGSVTDAWVYRLPEAGKHMGPLVVEGIPSAAGKSYRLILEEVFAIAGEFDVETEALFEAFYTAREQFIKSTGEPDDLLEIAKKLTKRSEESAQIIARELRQISRITGQEVELA